MFIHNHVDMRRGRLGADAVAMLIRDTLRASSCQHGVCVLSLVHKKHAKGIYEET
jgi:hypothetical protein